MELPIEIEVKKASGAENVGYGIIFCLEDPDNKPSSDELFYRILITTTGHYLISKKMGSGNEKNDWVHHLDWNDDLENKPNSDFWLVSDKLNKGYNEINQIRVEYGEDSTSTFNVYFNDKLATSFTDDATLKGNKFGFFAAVGDKKYENFPEVPVDVRFKLVNQASTKAIQTYKMPKRSSAQGCWDTGSFGY